MIADARQPPRPRVGVAACIGAGLFVLFAGLAVAASALDQNDIVVWSVFAAFLLEVPTLVLLVAWARLHGAWREVTIAALISAAGIIVVWLIYPIPGICSAVFGDDCPRGPRLPWAVAGTIVIAVLLVAEIVLQVLPAQGREFRVLPVVLSLLLVVAVVYFPAATMWSGGFSIPWW